jgi:hypothetical protein
LAENDAAAKLKARLNQWQEYVGEVQERPAGPVRPAGPTENDAAPASATPSLEELPTAEAAHAVVLSPEYTPERAAGPVAALSSAQSTEPPLSRAEEYALPVPARSHHRTSAERSSTTAEPLVVDHIDTAAGVSDAYDTLLDTAQAAPYEPFQSAAAHRNGRQARNGAHATADPRTKRISKDAEYRAHAQRQVDYARRVNAILSVCVILLIALISCLITFILDR